MSQQTLAHDWFPRPIPSNVLIGAQSWLYSSYAFLHYQSRRPVGLRIGSNTGIYHGSFFELGPEGEVEIGDYCSLVGAIIATKGRVVIGDYGLIAHEVVIADEVVAIPPIAGASTSTPRAAATTIIGANVWIGARAAILGGIVIGESAVIGAASVVTEQVPPFAIVAGNPARIVGTCFARDKGREARD
jgi:acetyltransferase-like isoleucine patch superfamily enzyme